MKVLLTVSALAIALAVAPVAASPAVRIVRGPSVFHPPSPGGERHVFWRDHDGDHDFWRRHRREFVGPAGPIFGAPAETGPENSPSPFVVAAPVFVDVAVTPAAGPAPVEWTSVPKIIEIGHAEPPRGRMPLIIYGD